MSSPYLKESLNARDNSGRSRVALVSEIGRQISALWERVVKRAEDIPVLRQAVRAMRVVTSFGWMVLVLTLVSWHYGRDRNWEELVAVAILLGTVWIGAVVWTVGRVRYRIDVDLATQRVVVGQSAAGSLTVTNEASRYCQPSVVEMPVGSTVAQFAVPVLPGNGTHSDIFVIPTDRRGVITVGPVSSVRGDGLGLFRRVQQWTGARELYVHPQTISITASTVGFIRDIEGAVTHDLSSSDVAFHALREYRPGDDRRSVHWRSTARTGKLMVRQFEETRRAHLLIVFDNDAGAWVDAHEYELGISVASSIGAAVMRERRELTFISQAGVVPSSSSQGFLDGVTLLEPGENTENLTDLARSAIDREPNASVIVLVTGSRRDTSLLHRAHSLLPVNALSYAMRISQEEQMHRTLLGKLAVVTISDLNDLPLAMRKAVIR